MQQARNGQTDGSMPVMPTGMHHTRVLRGVFSAGLFLNRQSVHIETQQNHRTRLFAFYQCYDAGLGDTSAYLQTQGRQLASHNPGGPPLLKTQLRKAVEIATQPLGVTE